MRVSIILLVFTWVTLEQVSSRRLWKEIVKGQSPSGIAAADQTNHKLSNDLGTQSMFQTLFHLERKHKGKPKPIDPSKPSKSVEDFETIQRAIEKLGPLDFAHDTQLLLEKGEEDTSIYRHLPGEKRGSVVFRRPTNDQGKQLILLSRAEDNLRIGRTKRTYVVLKQNPQVGNQYFVLYAYIRTNGPNAHKEVEWDVWDARGNRNEKNKPFGWTDCQQSNLVSCKGLQDSSPNDTPEYVDEDDMEIPDDGNNSESSESYAENNSPPINRIKRQESSTDPHGPFNHLVKSAAKILERTMADAKYDYFLDLRDDPVEAKLVGLTVDLVTKAVATLTVSKQVDEAMSQNSSPNEPGVVNKVLDALEASIKNFAGATSVIGLLVGGIENLGRKNGTAHVLGDYEAKLGKKFLENILNEKSVKEDKMEVKVNPNPAELLDPATVSKLSSGSSAQTGRGILGGPNQGGLLGNLGSVLGLSGLFGGLVKTTTTVKPEVHKKVTKKHKVMGEGISQKALATALVKNAQKEKAKLYSGLPDGARMPEEKIPAEGIPLRSMPTGGLAMLENGDMVHKLPSGGYVLLPKIGGLIHMTSKEISEKYGDAPRTKKDPNLNKEDPGLVGGLTNVVSGLLNNVGTVLKGGPRDKITGESKGIIPGVGGLVTDLLNGVNQVVNGNAGMADDEEEVIYEYEGDAVEAKGRAFVQASKPTTNEETTKGPFSPADCVTRRPGIKTWYDPVGLYPDPSDPCYFAPAANPVYHSIAPAVSAFNPYAYSYPFYPYFGRRKKREVSAIDTPTNQQDLSKVTSSDSKSDEAARKKRGWLFGNGSQQGNGCDGIFGIIGSILGNRKGCDANTNTVTIRGPDGNPIFATPGAENFAAARMNTGIPGDPYTISNSVSTYTLPPGGLPGGPPPGALGGLPPGALPPGALPPGALPPGALPPGALPPGALPPGGVPPLDLSSLALGRRKRSVSTSPAEKNDLQPSRAEESKAEVVSSVPPPVTRSEILARLASQLIHEIAATAVGVLQPPPVVLPGKSPVRGRELIDQGLDVLQFAPQTGRSLGQEDTVKAGLTDQMETDLFSHIGWLTQGYTQSRLPQASETRKSQVFIGFGTCPYKEMNVKEATSAELAIDFYLNLMRTGCDSGQVKKMLMTWVNEGCLQLITIKTNNALQLQKTCSYLNKSKLSKQDMDDLSKAFELAVFSQAYSAELNNKQDYTDGVSKTVRTLKDVVILAFKRGRTVAPLHLIKLTRCIVRTVKTALTKSLQDLVRYQSCSDCTKLDQEGASADVRALLEVIEYIIADSDPSNVDWQTYHQHTDKGNPNIDKRLKYYFVH